MEQPAEHVRRDDDGKPIDLPAVAFLIDVQDALQVVEHLMNIAVKGICHSIKVQLRSCIPP